MPAEGGAKRSSDGPFLLIEDIAKSYGGVQALKGVSLSLRPGEVHGLVGANGAGKSTLIRVLAGLAQPDRGRIVVDGRPVTIGSPHRATELGMNFIHQELAFVPGMTVVQNIMLGLPKKTRFGMIDWRAIARDVAPIAAQVGITAPLFATVKGLPPAENWLINICRALIRKARLIVMDEPTASLSAHEAGNLFRIVRQLRQEGIAILYVSHRLDEILDLCDRVTAFRDGARVMHSERAALTRAGLVEAIVGGSLSQASALPIAAVAQDEPVLAVTALARRPMVRGVDFVLRRREVLGFAGLVGAGRSELMRLIYGVDRPHGGSMVLAGSPFAPRTPRDAVKAGIGLVPEERRSEGLVLNRSVAFNMALPSNRRFALSPLPLLSGSRRDRWARSTAARVLVKTPSVGTPVQRLSGGNQQKVVIGRWIDRDLKILILDEPSRGVDIGARGEIHRLIRSLAAQGLAVIVVSSEAEELPGLCDRVLVMAEGRIVECLEGPAITRDAIVAASYKHAPQDRASA